MMLQRRDGEYGQPDRLFRLPALKSGKPASPRVPCLSFRKKFVRALSLFPVSTLDCGAGKSAGGIVRKSIMKITGLDEERHGRRWNGQRALVTGAGQGIGQAVAQLLASKGVKVAVNDIVPERAENTVKLVADAGGEAFAAIGDIADPTVVEDLFRQLDERFGGIDILVNVAGIIIKDSLDDTDLERWNRILAVNLTADFLTIKQAVKRMRKQHYGRIVNVSSIAAKHGGGYLGGVAYASTKAGVAALTRGAAREYAPDGINVNAVMPGLTYTPMTAGMPDWKREAIEDSTLVKHGGQPYDIARAIVFLADPESGYIDGETLDVDGGTSLD